MALQDPVFDLFKRAYQTENFDAALQYVKQLLVRYPQSFALRWHQAKVLEKLAQFAEARMVLQDVLRLRSQFVPALVLQVQLDFHEGTAEDAEFQGDLAHQHQSHFDAIEQRLYKILSIDPCSVDALHMLSGLLRGHADNAHVDKANQLLDRAISLAPERVDLLEDRANNRLASAVLDEDNPTVDLSNRVTTFAGIHYSRQLLTQALEDFQHCYALSQQHRYGLRAGAILHDLGRFNDAVNSYDQVLEHVPEKDPLRPYVLERRSRSDQNGGGERLHIAEKLAPAIANNAPEHGLNEANLTQAVLDTANAVHAQHMDHAETAVDDKNAAPIKPLDNAADELMVTSIAAQILTVANQPHPDLHAANPKDFPYYQQKFNAHCKHKLSELDLRHIGDAEARGLALGEGYPVLLSFFADEYGTTSILCYCLQAKQPNLLKQLLLVLSGQWQALTALRKITKMVECVSQFNNDDQLCTQYENASPFRYGAPIYQESISASMPLSDLVALHLQRVEEYQAEYPIAKAMRALDLECIEERWLRSQAVKRHYRTQLGYVSDAELQTLLGPHYAKFAQAVKDKIKALAADL